MAKKINSLLVANRGEIAVRIFETAKRLGIKTIAVYSDIDAGAMHVEMADRAVAIGGAAASESYLVAERIIEAAKSAGADAIHPGYGFLSENASFARAVRDAGLIFVGPSAEAIEIMGDKARAKRAMIAAGVPVIPGYQDDDQTDEALCREAGKIGFPLIVKAAAGGGGKGMRLVDDAVKLNDALAAARAEAQAAFGSSVLLLEKAISDARHVEIQIFGDEAGNYVHLGERDCSAQRRSQKIIEEAPSPGVNEKLRSAMGAAAINAARAVDYAGAGTVEFLLGPEDEFYFLEMNTRIQVEHPVTECVTGFDLVEWQLRVAEGVNLPAAQSDIELNCHAIEARLYAEDPAAGFLPASGDILLFETDESVRVDSGVRTGDAVSPYYDPMIAKITAYGADREDARNKLVSALRKTVVLGLATNRDFLLELLTSDAFAAGRMTTRYVEARGVYEPSSISGDEFLLASTILFVLERDDAFQRSTGIAVDLLNWSSGAPLASAFDFEIENERRTVSLTPLHDGGVMIDGHEIEVAFCSDEEALLVIDGEAQSVFFTRTESALYIASETRIFTAMTSLAKASAAEAASGLVTAPMHGVVSEICVAEGDKVAEGDRLCILEAMKMRHEIAAPKAGPVASIHAETGAQIASGDIILEIGDLEKSA
ncbi:MAG: biotin carboxylase N-terminal domain-containing protein [Parvularculaceae bacterium]